MTPNNSILGAAPLTPAATLNQRLPQLQMLSAMRRSHGGPVRLLATLIRCGDSVYMTFYMGPQTAPESHGQNLILGGHCSSNPKHPRSLEEVAREACARGDRRGCD